MKQIISGIIILLFIVAAVMSIAYYFPWVAVGLLLLIQTLQFIIKVNQKNDGEA